MRRSQAALVAVCGIGLAVLSSCSVPLDGRIGIARAQSGELEVVLRTCGSAMGVATVSSLSLDESSSMGQQVLGEWRLTKVPVEGLLRWPLLGPSENDVEATIELTDTLGLPDSLVLEASGNSYRADGPYLFAPADIESLEPGTVLTSDLRPLDDQTEVTANHAVVTEAAFEATDCTLYDN